MPEKWRETAKEATIQRMEAHTDLEAVANAMRVVPWSTAFEGMEQLEDLDIPTLVVASRDEADGLHPYDVAVEYSERLPERRAAGGGRGPVADRLAGRPALARDRGLPTP